MPAKSLKDELDPKLEPLQPMREIQEALRDLQFGQVTVVVQDGVVVQVERLEKRRLTRPCRKN